MMTDEDIDALRRQLIISALGGSAMYNHDSDTISAFVRDAGLLADAAIQNIIGNNVTWYLAANAPPAITVLAAWFDTDDGEWCVSVESTPLASHFTHYRMLGAMPDGRL